MAAAERAITAIIFFPDSQSQIKKICSILFFRHSPGEQRSIMFLLFDLWTCLALGSVSISSGKQYRRVLISRNTPLVVVVPWFSLASMFVWWNVCKNEPRPLSLQGLDKLNRCSLLLLVDNISERRYVVITVVFQSFGLTFFSLDTQFCRRFGFYCFCICHCVQWIFIIMWFGLLDV